MEFSSIESVKSRKSFQELNIYNIPDGETLKFMNCSKTDPAPPLPSKNKQLPKPYEIPTELLYQDPGVKKEKIYEWFEKKKYRKLSSADIKYVNYNNYLCKLLSICDPA